MTLLHALLLTDGNPGHEKQSRAILRALNRYVDLETEHVRLRQCNPDSVPILPSVPVVLLIIRW